MKTNFYTALTTLFFKNKKMKYKQTIITVFSCICLSIIYLFYSTKLMAKEIFVITPEKQISYSVEVADTPTLQRQGLMYRTNMPPNQGMLFVFDQSKPVSMWMKNTYIPLDMLFVDQEGIIRHIHKNAKPLDKTVITCPIPVKYVIEINAGQVQKNQIQVKNKIGGLP